MPWVNDEFVYEYGTVAYALSSCPRLEEQALHDPDSQGAATYYDLLRAIDGIRMNHWQLECFMLQLTGMDDTAIGYVQGCTRITVSQRMGMVRAQVRACLLPECEEDVQDIKVA